MVHFWLHVRRASTSRSSCSSPARARRHAAPGRELPAVRRLHDAQPDLDDRRRSCSARRRLPFLWNVWRIAAARARAAGDDPWGRARRSSGRRRLRRRPRTSTPLPPIRSNRPVWDLHHAGQARRCISMSVDRITGATRGPVGAVARRSRASASSCRARVVYWFASYDYAGTVMLALAERAGVLQCRLPLAAGPAWSATRAASVPDERSRSAVPPARERVAVRRRPGRVPAFNGLVLGVGATPSPGRDRDRRVDRGPRDAEPPPATDQPTGSRSRCNSRRRSRRR